MPTIIHGSRQTRERGPLQADTDLARLAKALGHPARVRILRRLGEQAGCHHGSLAGELPLAASTVSQHLRILREAGLIQGEVDGPRTCYCINRERVAQAAALVGELVTTPSNGACS